MGEVGGVDLGVDVREGGCGGGGLGREVVLG